MVFGGEGEGDNQAFPSPCPSPRGRGNISVIVIATCSEVPLCTDRQSRSIRLAGVIDRIVSINIHADRGLEPRDASRRSKNTFCRASTQRRGAARPRLTTGEGEGVYYIGSTLLFLHRILNTTVYSSYCRRRHCSSSSVDPRWRRSRETSCTSTAGRRCCCRR